MTLRLLEFVEQCLMDNVLLKLPKLEKTGSIDKKTF